MLEVDGLTVGYQELIVLRDVNVSVKDGELVSIVGSNGAGKTTFLKVLAGILKPKKGSVRLNGEEITRLPPYDRVTSGLVYVPEGRRLFPYLTVKENLDVGAYTPKARKSFKENLEFVYKLFPRLKERLGQQAITLSGGEQQMLAIGRGIMSQPQLMMLDEPSLGLSPKLMDEIFETVTSLHDRGLTLLLVEQNARRALELSDRAYILENGSVALEGTGKGLMHDERVSKAYLGL